MPDRHDKIPNESLTVLMPVYNAALHVREAIQSILVQTFEDFEFLIIDDASTDDTVNIIRSFSDKRIRLICRDKNSGIKDTLNEGIGLTNTELIARMDADDISHPWRLEKQMNFLSNHRDHAMVCSLARVIDKDGDFIQAYDPYLEDLYYGLFFDCYICHPSVMYRKRCVEAVGKYTMQYGEDFDLWWKLARFYKIHLIHEPLLLYRLHQQNYSKVAKKEEYKQAEFKIIERNLRYLLGNSVPIPKAFISCYHHDYKPLASLKNATAIKNCMALLEAITARIIALENPNRNVEAISRSAADKKHRILYNVGLNLPYFKMIKLLRSHGLSKLIWIVSKDKIKRKVVIKKRLIGEVISKKRKFNLRLLLWNN